MGETILFYNDINIENKILVKEGKIIFHLCTIVYTEEDLIEEENE